MKRAVGTFLVLVVVFAGLLSHQLGHFQAGMDDSSDTDSSDYEYYTNEEVDEENAVVATLETAPEKKKLIDVDTKEDSITVLVNRKYRMNRNYVPVDLVVPSIRFSFYGTYEKSYVRKVTAEALKQLFDEGEKQGVILKGVSGYRSYARQEQIYNRNVSTRGRSTTNLVSANPGASEHQTGLAIDVSSESVGCALEESFGNTLEGKWLAKNCHKFGFVIRYPKDKTDITGYSYEPWHIRYVGKKLATHLYKNKLTLEEYYQITTEDEKITEPIKPVNDIEDDKLEGPEMTSAPTPVPTRRPLRSTPVPTRSTSTRKPTSSPRHTKPPKQTDSSEDANQGTVTDTPENEVSPVEPAIPQEPVSEPTPQQEEAPAEAAISSDTTETVEGVQE